MTLTPRKIYEDDEYLVLKFVYESGFSEVFVFNKKNSEYVSLDIDGRIGNA